jgi:hypothetical protein
MFKMNYLKRQGARDEHNWGGPLEWAAREKRKRKAKLVEENWPRKGLGFSKYFSFSID